VFTVLQHPQATPSNFQKTAALFGVHVTKTAILNRFTDELISFLWGVLGLAMKMTLAVEPATCDLLQNFTAVFLGDATSLGLPEAFAKQFPGCGGTQGTGRAMMKIQVLWDFLSGSLCKLVVEPGKNRDAKSEIAHATVPAGSLSVFDLGYFCPDRFRHLMNAVS
jgi:hypothetical protein